jgi:phage I-like protein
MLAQERTAIKPPVGEKGQEPPMTLLLATHAAPLEGGVSGRPPEWVHLIPAGQFAGRDGRGPYILKDAQAVVAASNREGLEAVIDYDHQTDLSAVKDVGGTAPAAGWIKVLEARADGIWGKVEWTERGAAAVTAREYRYLSPVCLHTRAGEVKSILRAGLTNNPNLHLAALASQETKLQPEGKDMNELLKALAAALGLPADSDQAAIMAALTALVTSANASTTAIATMAQAAGVTAGDDPAATATAVQAAFTAAGAKATATPDPNKFVPIEMVTSLQAQVKTLMDERGAGVVDQAIKSGKVPPANRDWAVAYHAKDPAGFSKFLEGQPAILTPGAKPGGKTEGGDGALDAEDIAVAAAMGLTPEEFTASRKKETA